MGQNEILRCLIEDNNWQSHKEIGEKIGVSSRSVAKGANRLYKVGWVKRKKSGNNKRTCLYKLGKKYRIV